MIVEIRPGRTRIEPAVVRRMTWDAHASRDIYSTANGSTNGLGGYASGTVSARLRVATTAYFAALPAPLGRMVMWSHVSEFLHFGEEDVVSLGAEERAGGQLDLHSADYLTEFRLEDGLPIWTYRVRDLVIEKGILLPYLQNTVHISYRIVEGFKRRAGIAPAFQFGITRCREQRVDRAHKLTAMKDAMKYLRIKDECLHCDAAIRYRNGVTISPSNILSVYRSEQSRGYPYEGNLWVRLLSCDMRKTDCATSLPR